MHIDSPLSLNNSAAHHGCSQLRISRSVFYRWPGKNGPEMVPAHNYVDNMQHWIEDLFQNTKTFPKGLFGVVACFSSFFLFSLLCLSCRVPTKYVHINPLSHGCFPCRSHQNEEQARAPGVQASVQASSPAVLPRAVPTSLRDPINGVGSTLCHRLFILCTRVFGAQGNASVVVSLLLCIVRRCCFQWCCV
jgi:hypothetical protein